MKTKFILLTACYMLFFITSFAQTNTSSTKKIICPPAWLLKGNSGTDTSINFIGTRDARPLLFKVNNQKAGYLDYDSSAGKNTSFGYQSLGALLTPEAASLSAFGYRALYSNTTGFGNTAQGTGALFFNTTGNINTAVGVEALFSNTSGGFNTAVGYNSLYSSQTGEFNTATGDYTLAGNTTGSFNTAIGTPFTLSANTEGFENTATGALSMFSNATGNANTAYGVYSLATNTTGNNNTALGYGSDVSAGDLANATAVGYGALADASNKVRIGNTDVTSIGGQVNWTSFSDERVKDNVKENVPGLVFIKALRPVTYHFNIAKENELLGVKDISTKIFQMPEYKGAKISKLKDIQTKDLKNISNKSNHDLEKIQFTGFLAQDVDNAAKSIGYDFSGVDRSGKLMGLRYSDFVVPLVKAVQELSKMNDEKDTKIDGLQKQINELKTMIGSNSNKTNITVTDASLEQNMPNPFSNTTILTYNLPQKFTSAQIVVTDNNGKMLKQVNISGNGKGTMNIDASTLAAGSYSYSLIIDGKVISSKQMIINR